MPVELLRRYVAGDLPSAEQHTIEAHTLACTQCADILEGLSQTDAATTDRALTELHQRLQARVGSGAAGRPIGGMWWQAAAAILVLVIAGTFFWMRPHRQPAASSPAQQAVVTRTPAAAPQPEAAAPVTTPAPLAAKKIVAVVQPVSKPVAQKKTKARRTRYVATMRNKWRNVPPAPAAGAGKASLATTKPSPDSGQYAAQVAPLSAMDSAAATTTAAGKAPAVSSPETLKPATQPARRISGRLTDGPTGKALAGVAVHATGTAVQSKTNEDGRFELLVPAGVSSLTFMAAGYRDNERVLGPDSMLALSMTPLTSTAPSTVVPEGRGRAAKMPTIPDIAPTPAGGLAAFNQYVEREVRYPEKDPPAAAYGAKVAVKLRFIVAADGSLQDIKVVEPLSDEYDAEAIRLLKEGPAWYPAVVNGQRIAHKAQVSVIFRFDNR
ncbi:hypothetical protein AM218_14295 [Hymenobacter sp. DG25A]|nr:hypothetical protein AM218_14295 [Hymenobacter sp. DG25A]